MNEDMRRIIKNLRAFENEIISRNIQPTSTSCNHIYKKTLAKNGMCFINMCHKCGDQQPFVGKMK